VVTVPRGLWNAMVRLARAAGGRAADVDGVAFRMTPASGSI
jgi:hypothetical protein